MEVDPGCHAGSRSPLAIDEACNGSGKELVQTKSDAIRFTLDWKVKGCVPFVYVTAYSCICRERKPAC